MGWIAGLQQVIRDRGVEGTQVCGWAQHAYYLGASGCIIPARMVNDEMNLFTTLMTEHTIYEIRHKKQLKPSFLFNSSPLDWSPWDPEKFLKRLVNKYIACYETNSEDD